VDVHEINDRIAGMPSMSRQLLVGAILRRKRFSLSTRLGERRAVSARSSD